MIVCIIITLAFIFYQSLLPSEKSASFSDFVGDFLTSFISGSSDAEQSGGNLQQPENNVTDSGAPDAPVAKYPKLRKAAHFTEHGILGVWVLLLLIAMESERRLLTVVSPIRFKTFLLSLNIGVIVALVDETIQIFSNRSAEVVDMWIDISGYFTFTVILYVGFVVFRFFKIRNIRRHIHERGDK